MTIEQKEQITELLVKILQGIDAAQIALELIPDLLRFCYGDNTVNDNIRRRANATQNDLKEAANAVDELKQYLMKIDKGDEDNE